MSKGKDTDTDALASDIDTLKQLLDSLEIANLDNEKIIENYLDQIDDVYIKTKQYVSRYDINDWKPWGPPKWNDIERNKIALERKLKRLVNAQNNKIRKHDRNLSFWGTVFVAISAVAALISAYFAYEVSTSNNTQKKKNKSLTPLTIKRMMPSNQLTSGSILTPQKNAAQINLYVRRPRRVVSSA